MYLNLCNSSICKYLGTSANLCFYFFFFRYSCLDQSYKNENILWKNLSISNSVFRMTSSSPGLHAPDSSQLSTVSALWCLQDKPLRHRVKSQQFGRRCAQKVRLCSVYVIYIYIYFILKINRILLSKLSWVQQSPRGHNKASCMWLNLVNQ